MTRLQTRRIARWLVAAMLFSVLHPALAAGLALVKGTGDMVQICTGAGMAWVRIVDASAQSAGASVAPGVLQNLSQDLTQDGQPAGSDAASPASPCPFCLGAALAAGGEGDPGLTFNWPRSAAQAPASPPIVAPPCARVILDAPMRGPPGA